MGLQNNESPILPIDNDHAFLQLRKDEKGQIVPSYKWEVCVKKFIFCFKKEKKIVFFHDLSWFFENKWGLTKRRTPK